MINQQLQMELNSLQAKLSVSQALVSAAQGQASIPIMPNSPAIGLVAMAQAIAAQQNALDQIQKVLKKMV